MPTSSRQLAPYKNPPLIPNTPRRHAGATSSVISDSQCFDRLEQNESEIRRCGAKRKKLQSESHDLLRKRAKFHRCCAERTEVCYAKTSCLKLCDAMYSKLPRELRDHIYSYIFRPDSILTPVVPRQPLKYLAYPPDAIEKVTGRYSLPSGVKWKHAIESEFVGEEVAREIRDRMWATMPFRVGCLGEQGGVLGKFLQGVYGGRIGRLVPRNFIRSLSVKARSEYIPPVIGRPDKPCFYEREMRSACGRVQSDLRELLTVEHPDGFVLHIIITMRHTFLTRDQWDSICKCIHPVYLELLEKGFQTRLYLESLDDGYATKERKFKDMTRYIERGTEAEAP